MILQISHISLVATQCGIGIGIGIGIDTGIDIGFRIDISIANCTLMSGSYDDTFEGLWDLEVTEVTDVTGNNIFSDANVCPVSILELLGTLADKTHPISDLADVLLANAHVYDMCAVQSGMQETYKSRAEVPSPTTVIFPAGDKPMGYVKDVQTWSEQTAEFKNSVYRIKRANRNAAVMQDPTFKSAYTRLPSTLQILLEVSVDPEYTTQCFCVIVCTGGTKLEFGLYNTAVEAEYWKAWVIYGITDMFALNPQSYSSPRKRTRDEEIHCDDMDGTEIQFLLDQVGQIGWFDNVLVPELLSEI